MKKKEISLYNAFVGLLVMPMDQQCIQKKDGWKGILKKKEYKRAT